ncbi:MAG: four helix bundle protein [Flavobacteriaceae bacterium CG_4_8_14_3_um_filter_34_10]|nr:four helix bundle protein [Flavobacteriia bacterium]PIQ18511.1 MAG: four helix bundle protein [Flavobacteriaceae bacterium CG18_big_fil_WC_8_21_14_2_50_34_36]PIV49836.1 MAG: four helix bundle protein [Flavobacteriaceae bacterium CG02_land_8_20_14_3_00_34_13]PIX08757.1 MAG: four helix bundle protein [Flavobacteriaceae bacterium CG_4_8_14_3_um_filter_34_10]PIZ07074.1 MAG: four helix bundle protein [Flavobacteriaceae bacterium CG_4_10_14_0_8_um_filter_34_31]PJC06045.1 MAG: four helix bundle pr
MNANILEERLIQFAVNVILMCKKVENNFAAQHLANQLIRSATSVALNYGEARSAESTIDFLHKLKICLKELRECLTNMNIQKGADLIKDIDKLNTLIKENDELISIFVVSIKTSSQKIKNH